jgi:hypothetical protein
MRRVAAAALAAFLVAALIWRILAPHLARGWAEAASLASAGVAMAIGAAAFSARRRTEPRVAGRPSAEASPQRASA